MGKYFGVLLSLQLGGDAIVRLIFGMLIKWQSLFTAAAAAAVIA